MLAGPEGCTDRAKPVRLVTRYRGAVDAKRSRAWAAGKRYWPTPLTGTLQLACEQPSLIISVERRWTQSRSSWLDGRWLCCGRFFWRTGLKPTRHV